MSGPPGLIDGEYGTGRLFEGTWRGEDDVRGLREASKQQIYTQGIQTMSETFSRNISNVKESYNGNMMWLIVRTA